MESDPLNHLRPIVLIDPDRDGQEWLHQQLISTGRPIRRFADVQAMQLELRVEEVDAILVVIGQEPGGDDAPVGGRCVDSLRAAASWARASNGQPVLFALARHALSPAAIVTALHRGATSVINFDQWVILREILEAQLRAIPATKSTSMRQVTRTPRSTLDESPFDESGWIPRPVDFQITDSDPIDLKLYERKAVLRAIAAADGNRTLAAQLLGIGKSTLYRRLSEWRTSQG